MCIWEGQACAIICSLCCCSVRLTHLCCRLNRFHPVFFSLTLHKLAWLLMHFIFMCGFFFGRITYSCSLTVSLRKPSGTLTLAGPFSAIKLRVQTLIYRASRPWLNKRHGGSLWGNEYVGTQPVLLRKLGKVSSTQSSTRLKALLS